MKKSTNINREPTQCHLWKDANITMGEVINSLECIKTYVKDSHFSRKLMKCTDCGQLYVKEFYETVDWEDGEDPQYHTFVPVINEKDAEEVNKANINEIHAFSPRLNIDWPKGKEQTMYWVDKPDTL
ncbi:hypothetical protein KJ937_04645 [Patescibacteria group bacterium]|nr:hypothetical protein [Patescibacteria group bacterium]